MRLSGTLTVLGSFSSARDFSSFCFFSSCTSLIFSTAISKIIPSASGSFAMSRMISNVTSDISGRFAGSIKIFSLDFSFSSWISSSLSTAISNICSLASWSFAISRIISIGKAFMRLSGTLTVLGSFSSARDFSTFCFFSCTSLIFSTAISKIIPSASGSFAMSRMISNGTSDISCRFTGSTTIFSPEISFFSWISLSLSTANSKIFSFASGSLAISRMISIGKAWIKFSGISIVLGSFSSARGSSPRCFFSSCISLIFATAIFKIIPLASGSFAMLRIVSNGTSDMSGRLTGSSTIFSSDLSISTWTALSLSTAISKMFPFASGCLAISRIISIGKSFARIFGTSIELGTLSWP